MQQRLFETDDEEKRVQLLPVLLKEMGSMRRRILNLELSLRSLERVIVDDRAAVRPRRHHSFDVEALVFIQETYLNDPAIKSHELIKKLKDEAPRRGWRIGSIKTLYRVIKELRLGVRLEIPDKDTGPGGVIDTR
ncbi:MAG: hypothetical protein U1D96_05235 [Eubacteriales bacterium]|nr:hypothetical protein [Eubacteriales bacterium]